MSYNPLNPNGQTTMANSQPIVIASNQTPVSVAGTLNIAGIPSISGTVNVGNTINVVVGSSVLTVGGGVANQSVSGIVGASIIGIANVNIVGSVVTIGTAAPNQSVSGTIGASIIGQLPAGNQVIGAVAASISGIVPVIVTGSVLTVGGSIGSVSGTVGASVIGLTPVAVTNTPSISGTVLVGNTNINVSGSVVGFQGGTQISSISGLIDVSGSIAGTYKDSNVASTVSGLAIMFKANISSSIMQAVSPTFPLPINGSVSGTINIAGNPSISGQVGASIIGLTPVNIVGAPSVYGNISGSVVGFQGGTQISSISGTVVVQSIVGTYAEDAGHTSGDSGLFVLAVRNDTLASVASNDLDYTLHAVGPAGETIVANSPITKWVSGVTSVFTGGSVVAIAAQGSSIFTYITGVQVANMSANNVLVTLSGATSSIIGFTIAPANGGSNIVYRNPLRTNANGVFSASISGVASVYLSAQGFISKT